MEHDERNMLNFSDGQKINMTIPERIVLSAGYDGDENNDIKNYQEASTFDEPPFVNADKIMGGMHTPPSVLTIDHSSDFFKSTSPNWHTEGDGADEDDTLSSLQKYARLKEETENNEDYSSVISPHRSVVIAGEENHYRNSTIPFDDQRAMQKWYISMQRRLTLLENELEYQRRISNVWKYFLLTLSIVNPIIINYFFGRRR